MQRLLGFEGGCHGRKGSGRMSGTRIMVTFTTREERLDVGGE